MRNVNVVKYRRLLQELQYFCKSGKSGILSSMRKPNKRYFTDYERGYITGQHKAYNEVLRELNARIDEAEYDWDFVHCREERNSN